MAKRKPTRPPAATYPTAQVVHTAFAPSAARYVDVTTLKVAYVNSGATGYTASSGPAAGTLTYNTYYDAYFTKAQWEQTVAHEVGGHHDLWARLCQQVGVSQAWSDYYDIDYFAKAFFERRWLEMRGTPKEFTLVRAKEMYLDFIGPIRMGYYGAYVQSAGLYDPAEVARFGEGVEEIYQQAVSLVRP